MDKPNTGGVLAPRIDKQELLRRRNEIAFLALFYAISGQVEKSEKFRRVIRRLDENC